MLFSPSVRDNRAGTEQYIGVGTQRGRAMPAKFLSSRLMVRVLMAFLATGEARHGNVVSALLRDVVRLAAFSALANGVPCRFCSVVAALCPTCRACSARYRGPLPRVSRVVLFGGDPWRLGGLFFPGLAVGVCCRSDSEMFDSTTESMRREVYAIFDECHLVTRPIPICEV